MTACVNGGSFFIWLFIFWLLPAEELGDALVCALGRLGAVLFAEFHEARRGCQSFSSVSLALVICRKVAVCRDGP